MRTLSRTTPARQTMWMENELARIFGGHTHARVPHKAPDFTPAVDVREAPGGYTLTVEIPGLSASDVTLEVDDGELKLSGEKKVEAAPEGTRAHRLERRQGQFSRIFALPRDVDSDRIAAAAKDGLLTVARPRREEMKARAITVETA